MINKIFNWLFSLLLISGLAMMVLAFYAVPSHASSNTFWLLITSGFFIGISVSILVLSQFNNSYALNKIAAKESIEWLETGKIPKGSKVNIVKGRKV